MTQNELLSVRCLRGIRALATPRDNFQEGLWDEVLSQLQNRTGGTTERSNVDVTLVLGFHMYYSAVNS